MCIYWEDFSFSPLITQHFKDVLVHFSILSLVSVCESVYHSL